MDNQDVGSAKTIILERLRAEAVPCGTPGESPPNPDSSTSGLVGLFTSDINFKVYPASSTETLGITVPALQHLAKSPALTFLPELLHSLSSPTALPPPPTHTPHLPLKPVCFGAIFQSEILILIPLLTGPFRFSFLELPESTNNAD